MHCYPMCFAHLCTRAIQVKLMGTRERAAELDFSAVALEEEVESELKEAAVISMGTEISEADLLNIMALCDQARPCRRAAWRERRDNGLADSLSDSLTGVVNSVSGALSDTGGCA